MSKSYYITTPIYYVNGPPHVGSALTTIACDVLARYHRMRGYDSWLLTGTDENATKVQEAAEKAGVPTPDFVEKLAATFRTSWDSLHIGYNDFIRTSEPRHVHACQVFFARLLERGYVYLDTYEGWYSVSDETFFLDDKVKDGFAIESGKPVVRVQEQNYFFRLSAFGDRLLAHIEANPDFLLPEFRRNEVVAFLKEGLRDMCITRANHGWGIEVPGDPSKVIYVWFDALINYLAATGWPDDPNWESRWPADMHFMGKEIFVRFHATLWPAMLMALDLPLPRQVFAHGWWTAKGIIDPITGQKRKSGKSTGGLPPPDRFTEFLAQRTSASLDLAADAQRYLLCREMNFGQDTDFEVENCLRRYNTDLANDLGNLLNRSINMMERYFEGVVPAVTEHDPEIGALALQVQEEYVRALAECRLNIALEAVWKLVARMNKYIDEKAPWTLAKAATTGDAAAKAELERVLYACLEVTRVVSLLIAPFMPVAADTLRAQLGITRPAADSQWAELAWGGLVAGTTVGPPEPVFPRIQDLKLDTATLIWLGVLVEAEKTKEIIVPVSETETVPTPTAPQPGALIPPGSETPVVEPPITIENFMKIQLKVGEVLAAEPVPNATKLLRLTVQVGEDDTRTILAGIAEYYQPETLIGRLVVLVANLQPRKMRGIESQGMLLAADVDGRAILLQPDSPVPPGSRVR